MRSGHIRVTPGSFLQGAYSFAPIARKFRYCIAEAAAAEAAQAAQEQQTSSTQARKLHKASSTQAYKHTSNRRIWWFQARPGRGPGEAKAVHPSPNTMPSPEAPKLQSAHGHMPKVHAAALCSGASTQALKRTQQRRSATSQHPSSPAHPAAAPAPKLEHANAQLFLHWNNSSTLRRHQHPRSKTHTRSSLKYTNGSRCLLKNTMQ